MIPQDEARLTREYEDFYAICPTHRTWQLRAESSTEAWRPCADDFCYCSDNNPHWLSVEELRGLVSELVPV